ncbi:alpha/beta hydrolase [Winogradskyella flava]|uniref:alpha/beta hydrolase n=1 Tax=Winogradskyella flava TaxID=1884876 RepID=UPI0024929916|nr:alpha/beta hydrolase-fold protein [Winogradskyella flava]
MKKWTFIVGLILMFLSCKNEKEERDSIAKNQNETSEISTFKPVNDVKLEVGKLMRMDSISSKYITSRPVDVWLPEDYSEEKEYAVLYMHDGQMLFDSTTTWNKQEWKVDEWASQLMTEKKVKEFIVVAIHNIPQIRWQDLFPQKAYNFIDDKVKDSLRDIAGKKNIKLNGDNYLRFLVEELKPKIERSYAVHTDRENTFVMGSSMGGLMSMYAISEYPTVFGGAACLSTHWVGAMPMEENPYPEAIFKYMEANFPKAGSHNVYFDYGNKTLDAHYPQYAPHVDEILKQKGYTEADSKNLFFEDTDHSENSWNSRLDVPFTFLLGNK